MPKVAAVYIRNIIDEICEDIAMGDEIMWEASSLVLQWVWTNTRTGKEWKLGINLFRRLIYQGHGDPRLPAFRAFVSNRMAIPDIQKEMLRLERLKAFW
jgi:hypothetical protein